MGPFRERFRCNDIGEGDCHETLFSLHSIPWPAAFKKARNSLSSLFCFVSIVDKRK